jgi:hypothetical protein
MGEIEGRVADQANGPSSDQLSDREPLQVRKGPALIVIAIALFLIIGGGLLALLPGGTASSNAGGTGLTGAGAAGESGVATPGVATVVPVISATKTLAKIRDSGSLPSDIQDAMVIPAKSTVTGTKDLDQGAGQFDREVDLSAPYTKSDLITSYRTELPLLGWSITGTSTVTTAGVTGTEILAQHESSDGYYWEVGVTIDATDQSVSPALGGASSTTSSSAIAIRILEVADGD